MHDFLEGLLPIEMKLVVGELISQDLFDLNELNSRIISFSYGNTDQANKPTPITQGQLNHPFGASGQTSSQMHCLAINLPLIIGDKVHHESEFWELFLVLLEIYRMVIAPSMRADGVYYLRARVQHHHQLFLELFPDHHLIPKHHNLTHYHRAIQQLGPLMQYSCMRHEAKHKPLKMWARNCKNFKNIALLLAKKHQDNQAFKYLSKQDIDSKSTEIQSQYMVQVSELNNDGDICDLLGCAADTEILVCGVVLINGYRFRSNTMVLLEWNEEVPRFGRIDLIIIFKSELQFLVRPWTTLNFDEHYHAFAARETSSAAIELAQPGALEDYRPVHAVKSYDRNNHCFYIPTRFLFV